MRDLGNFIESLIGVVLGIRGATRTRPPERIGIARRRWGGSTWWIGPGTSFTSLVHNDNNGFQILRRGRFFVHQNADRVFVHRVPEPRSSRTRNLEQFNCFGNLVLFFSSFWLMSTDWVRRNYMSERIHSRRVFFRRSYYAYGSPSTFLIISKSILVGLRLQNEGARRAELETKYESVYGSQQKYEVDMGLLTQQKQELETKFHSTLDELRACQQALTEARGTKSVSSVALALVFIFTVTSRENIKLSSSVIFVHHDRLRPRSWSLVRVRFLPTQ